MQPKNDHTSDPFLKTDADRKAASDRTLWSLAGTLYRHRVVLVVVPFVIAVVTAGITLLVPNYYRASATVLMPEGGSGPLSAAMFRNLPSAASSLFGGSSGDFVRYMAILRSRAVMESAVDSFQLVKVYDVEEEDHPREAAMTLLRDNFEVELDQEYDYLQISVSDVEPERAASIANFLVRRLNELNARLASQNAASYRQFIEERYFRARAEMDSVLDATAQFQREHGVYNLPTQAEGFFEQVANLRARALEAEIQYEALSAQYGPENTQVQTYREIAQSANRKYLNALQGEERLLPIPQTEVPSIGRRYVDLELERTIQQTILEVLGPMYEQARLQEEQQSQAVQVLDTAVPPVKKAGPKRTVIVLGAALSALILTILYLLVSSWWRSNHVYVAQRLKRESEAPQVETSTSI